MTHKICLIYDEGNLYESREEAQYSLHSLRGKRKEESIIKLLDELCEWEDDEPWDDTTTFDEKITYCCNALSDPGDGYSNILYLSIDGKNYQNWLGDDVKDDDLETLKRNELTDFVLDTECFDY